MGIKQIGTIMSHMYIRISRFLYAFTCIRLNSIVNGKKKTAYKYVTNIIRLEFKSKKLLLLLLSFKNILTVSIRATKVNNLHEKLSSFRF